MDNNFQFTNKPSSEYYLAICFLEYGVDGPVILNRRYDSLEG